jgi:hypothetical protein
MSASLTARVSDTGLTSGTMITWTQFEQQAPDLARAGREQLYAFDVALGFLATVRPDGAPRVHPVCPVISPAGLHVLIVDGPKLEDLRRDGRYALHSETFPPPREEDGFSVSGRAAEVADPGIRAIVTEQVRGERGGVLWPGFDDQALLELLVDRGLLMLTHPVGPFPKGPTIWRAPNQTGEAPR